MAADGISGGGNGGYRFDMPSMHGVDFSKEDLKISLPKKIPTIEIFTPATDSAKTGTADSAYRAELLETEALIAARIAAEQATNQANNQVNNQVNNDVAQVGAKVKTMA